MLVDIQKYLKPKENEIYAKYMIEKIKHFEQGTHYWQRLNAAKQKLKYVDIKHAIAWQDQFDLDSPLKVTHPTASAVAELMLGRVHPPIEAHHEAKILMVNTDKSGDIINKIDAPEYRNENDVEGEFVVDYRQCHNTVMESLTYEQAIEYITYKDVPYAVWGQKHNRPQLFIVDRCELPSRENRKYWKLGEFSG